LTRQHWTLNISQPCRLPQPVIGIAFLFYFVTSFGSLRFIRSFIAFRSTGLGVDDIAAQALLFFVAGFEVVAILLSFSTLLLAVHQDIQEQVREEMDKVLAEHGGQITYEAVQSIKCLDNILSGIGERAL
jgi:hypothetical protein